MKAESALLTVNGVKAQFDSEPRTCLFTLRIHPLAGSFVWNVRCLHSSQQNADEHREQAGRTTRRSNRRPGTVRRTSAIVQYAPEVERSRKVSRALRNRDLLSSGPHRRFHTPDLVTTIRARCRTSASAHACPRSVESMLRVIRPCARDFPTSALRTRWLRRVGVHFVPS